MPTYAPTSSRNLLQQLSSRTVTFTGLLIFFVSVEEATVAPPSRCSTANWVPLNLK